MLGAMVESYGCLFSITVAVQFLKASLIRVTDLKAMWKHLIGLITL